MDLSIPHRTAPGHRGSNPWRAVLELKRGSGPNLGGKRSPKESPLVVGLGTGLPIGLTFGAVLVAVLYWLLG